MKDVIQTLASFVAIESVSTDPKRRAHMDTAVSFLRDQLSPLGFTVEVLEAPDAAPLVFARRPSGNPDSKTIAIYGHYDVQPEDPVPEWQIPPFILTERDGRYYGRGVADNKGHVIQNIAALSRLITAGQLQHNVILLIEGEEEVGSTHFEELIADKAPELAAADVYFVTDTGMYDRSRPQIFYGLRGLVYFELELRIGTRDLHSGVYGNRAINPAQVLAALMASMKDPVTGRVTIPGFYDAVRPITSAERAQLAAVSRTDDQECREAGVFKVVSLDAEQPWLSSKRYPSLDINGMSAGFTGEGQKTIIPKSAMVKFSCRLVEDQDPTEMERLIEGFVHQHIPKGVEYSIKKFKNAAPFYTDFDNDYVIKTSEALSAVFGNKTLLNRSGGSIPAAEILSRRFGKPIILTGFTLPDDNIHAPNENFDKESFLKGIDALQTIYTNI